jgi:hypothetical protein
MHRLHRKASTLRPVRLPDASRRADRLLAQFETSLIIAFR